MFDVGRRIQTLAASVNAHRREALRLAAQAAAASALAYLVMTGLGIPHVSWAVIAALFTIHPSADSTLRTGAARFLAAILGIAIGLISVALVGGESLFLVRLLIATAAAGAIAAIWPSMNYVGVLAVIVALHSDPELGDALVRGLAVMVGAAAGTLATLAVWPSFGANRAVRQVEDALRRLRDLLDLILRSVDEQERYERDNAHGQFLATLEKARATTAEAWLAPRLANGVPLRDLLLAIERLWHALVILDRAVTDEGGSLDEPSLSVLSPHIENAQRATCAFVDAMIETLGGGDASLDHAELDAAISRGHRAAAEFLAQHGRAQDRRSRAVNALSFALDEVERNLADMARLIMPAAPGTGPRRARSRQREAALPAMRPGE